jgi:glycosyltransferase involved in cell wall biosynthesis
LANSRSGAKYLQDTFNLPSAQITVIPNAYVPGNEGSKLDLCPQPSTGGVLSLIQVANLFPEKDYDTLLRALQILNRKAPVCKLQLCGEFLKEADRARFVARVAELGIQKRTFHHGATTRDDVFRLLLDADVGVLSSKSEGQPNSVMEYMYVGLPVVGTRIPGIQELVGEENEEWLFDVGDADGLARVIERLRANPTLRTELGRRNHKRIIEHFAPGNVLPRWLELVEHD